MLDDRDIEPKGENLKGKKIDFVVTGGIALIESPKIIRELRRYGAEIRVFMTKAATDFVSPRVFEWAAKNPVVTDFSGSAEHITHADAVVVAPATLDFISRIAQGLADSVATTLVQSALGRLPLFFAPSMHSSLERNPIYQKNLAILKSIEDFSLLEPVSSEGKAKMIDFETAALQIVHSLSSSALRSKKILLSLGPTRSMIDDMRFVSNRSTGSLGIAIATELFRRGSYPRLVAGPLQANLPAYLMPLTSFVETNQEMFSVCQQIVDRELPKAIIYSAAILDYDVANPASGKTSSQEAISLHLKPSQKLIQALKTKDAIRVAFKLESQLSVDDLKKRVRAWVNQTPAEFVVANRLEDVKSESHTAYIYSKERDEFHEFVGKEQIAKKICDLLELNLRT